MFGTLKGAKTFLHGGRKYRILLHPSRSATGLSVERAELIQLKFKRLGMSLMGGYFHCLLGHNGRRPPADSSENSVN
eukprot:5990689-Amphidinium_carterae.1